MGYGKKYHIDYFAEQAKNLTGWIQDTTRGWWIQCGWMDTVEDRCAGSLFQLNSAKVPIYITNLDLNYLIGLEFWGINTGTPEKLQSFFVL